MSLAVMELYDALRKLGLDEDLARAAAKAVIGVEDRTQLATKADLAELKAELIKWNVGTLLALAAIMSTVLTILTLSR